MAHILHLTSYLRAAFPKPTVDAIPGDFMNEREVMHLPFENIPCEEAMKIWNLALDLLGDCYEHLIADWAASVHDEDDAIVLDWNRLRRYALQKNAELISTFLETLQSWFMDADTYGLLHPSGDEQVQLRYASRVVSPRLSRAFFKMNMAIDGSVARYSFEVREVPSLVRVCRGRTVDAGEEGVLG